MEGVVVGGQGVWSRGHFRVREHSLANPRRVKVVLVPGESRPPDFVSNITCVAICKQDCLKTQKKADAPFTTANLSACNYAHVILAECHVTESGSCPVPVTQPRHSLCLSASEEFLFNYGFFDGEAVWIQPAKPFSLERVILSLSSNSPTPITSQHVKQMVEQLYDHSQTSSVIAHRQFKFLHRMATSTKPPDQANTTTLVVGEDYVPTSLSSSSGSSVVEGEVPPLLMFEVLETVPLIQGAITSETRILVVPTELRTQATTPPGSNEQQLSPVSDESDIFQKSDNSLSPMRAPDHLRSISLSSASDLKFDENGHCETFPSVKEEEQEGRTTAGNTSVAMVPAILPPRAAIFSLPAAAAHNYKQKYHTILLPKQAAMEYGVQELQVVIVSPEETPQPLILTHQQPQLAPPSSPGLVLPLRNKKKDLVPLSRHLVVTKCYETEAELEQFMPQVALGRRYSQEELSMAYLHPELFFSLFPETLPISPTTYNVTIEVRLLCTSL